MDHFYHYTTAEAYNSMLSGYNYSKRGLLPIKRVIPISMKKALGLPDKATEGAVYGLTDPLESAWTTNEDYEDSSYLETIIRDKGGRDSSMVLLKCTLHPDDDAYVAEYAFHLRSDYEGMNGDNIEVTKTVKHAYWNSMVPASMYDGSYAMPEVICFNTISPNRLSVIQTFENGYYLLNHIRRAAGKTTLHFPKKKQMSAAQIKLLFE